MEKYTSLTREESNIVSYSQNVILNLSLLSKDLMCGAVKDKYEYHFLNAKDQFEKLKEIFEPEKK